jgi:hypothetical protein
MRRAVVPFAAPCGRGPCTCAGAASTGRVRSGARPGRNLSAFVGGCLSAGS